MHQNLAVSYVTAKSVLYYWSQFTVLIDEWQHHAAAVGVFLVWGELMLMIGRLPTFGIYVQVCTIKNEPTSASFSFILTSLFDQILQFFNKFM